MFLFQAVTGVVAQKDNEEIKKQTPKVDPPRFVAIRPTPSVQQQEKGSKPVTQKEKTRILKEHLIKKSETLRQTSDSLRQQDQTAKAQEVDKLAEKYLRLSEKPNVTLNDSKNLDKQNEALLRELGLWNQFEKWTKDVEAKLNEQKNKVTPPSVPKATRDYNEKKTKKNVDENTERGQTDSGKGKTETSGQQYAENTQKKAKAPKIKKEETGDNNIEKKVFTEQGPKQE